ncbi:dTDP-4-amino-4,6-dideoxygalactose transaminase [Vibrio hibernica]|uniref:dTDP-4-amino-4,6-dideoxygalactose transaminase n=1 Tax=Vibrio hibernica TaxID=2587465 RepID=UPI0039B087D9
MIEFNKTPHTGNEDKYVLEVMKNGKLSGDGLFTKRCQKWLKDQLQCDKALLTPSCTHALEMAAILIDTQPGDEIIMPSYTFVSTANAFLLRGAKIVFVDVRPDTMNIDESLIEAAITNKTKAIVPVHYAGVASEMDTILEVAKRYGLYVIEDAAQGVMSTYKGKPLGTLGDIGAFSFHDTKNYTSGGEGGLLIVNNSIFSERAEIIREKGTNRSNFIRGMVDKYTWVDLGSSFLPSDLQAAYLWGQLEKSTDINVNRLTIWHQYYDTFKPLEKSNKVSLPVIPNDCEHNAHMFYLKLSDTEQRNTFIKYLKENDIVAVFHYIPLHNSPAGKKVSVFIGEDKYTTQESEKLVRLPIYYGMTQVEQQKVINAVLRFFA